MGKIITLKGQSATEFVRAYRDAHYGDGAFAPVSELPKPSEYAMSRDYILKTYPSVPRDVRRGMRVYSAHYKRHGRITHFKNQYVVVKLQDTPGTCIFHPLDLEYCKE